MRYVLLFMLFCSLGLQSCHKKDQHFFDFDQIDYYNTDISEDEVMNLTDEIDTSETAARKSEVLMDHLPVSLKDTLFISKLKSMGFKEYSVAPRLFKEANDIFKTKDAKDIVGNPCVNIYRDILIFKKRHKTIGIVKICLGCEANHIVGTDTNTESFGREDDYAQLRSFLKKAKR